jgi:electron transfer flavoprotein alpha subunit
MTGRLAVVAESANGKLVPASREALGAALQLAGSGATVVGVLVGSNVQTAAKELAGLGAAEVVTVDDARFETTVTGNWATAVVAALDATPPELVLVGGTVRGRDLVARLAARWNAGAATGVTSLNRSDDGTVTVIRPIFGGRATETRLLQGPPVVVAYDPTLSPRPAPPAPPLRFERLPRRSSRPPGRRADGPPSKRRRRGRVLR